MADYATIARPYAEAIFQLAKETNAIEQWSNMLNFLDLLMQDEQIMLIVNNPRIEKNQLSQFILDIAKDHITATGQNLVRYLADNRRLIIIPDIVRQFEIHKANEQGYITVNLTSCYDLKPQQQQELTEKLTTRFGKKVMIEVTIDRNLIGGWVIRSQDKVIDLSIRGKLSQLAANVL